MGYKDTSTYKALRIPVKEFIMRQDRKRYKIKGISEAPRITRSDIAVIESQLMSDTKINDTIIHFKVKSEDYNRMESDLGFQSFYDKKNSPRYASKILEYLLADKLIGYKDHSHDNDYKYVDAASANSPWVLWLRNKYGINACSVDLLDPPNESGAYIKADVTKMPFEGDSIDSISMQSALETFPGEVDIEFIKEAARVLKMGGVLLISPLYMSTVYCNCFGKKYYGHAVPDEGAKKFIRLGYSGPTTRLYDVSHLKKRILETAEKKGLEYQLIILDMDMLMVDKWDPYMYSHFGLLFRKVR